MWRPAVMLAQRPTWAGVGAAKAERKRREEGRGGRGYWAKVPEGAGECG